MNINPFDLLKNLNIDDLKKKSDEMINNLKEIECVGESGAGFVKVKINGNFNIISIDFDVNNEIIKQDLVMFKDLVISAHNEAILKVREEIQKKFSNMVIPGLL